MSIFLDQWSLSLRWSQSKKGQYQCYLGFLYNAYFAHCPFLGWFLLDQSWSTILRMVRQFAIPIRNWTSWTRRSNGAIFRHAHVYHIRVAENWHESGGITISTGLVAQKGTKNTVWKKRNLLTNFFFDKNFVKTMFLAKKLLKTWFDEIFLQE